MGGVMKKATCRSCGAEIVWVQTKAGNTMPCDVGPVTYWERAKAKDKIVTPNGEVLSCVFEGDQSSLFDTEAATGIGYVPHWATCKYPEAHRKARTPK
jgi:hypothetical protein